MMMAAALISAGSPSISLGFCCSQIHRKRSLCLSPSAVFFEPRNPRSRFCRSIHLISHWNGLKHPGVSPRRNYSHKENKGKCRGRVVYASLFGVGAPEALVIGVVALLIFGPKGLAEVARNLGQTLRAFQPTIRELQDVSREFKSSLEREIGLDEIASSTNNIYKSTSPVNQNQQDGKLPTKPYTSEELLKTTSEELLKTTEEQLASSAIRPKQESSSLEAQTQAATETSEAAATIKPEAAASSVSPETVTAQIQTSSSDIADSVR